MKYWYDNLDDMEKSAVKHAVEYARVYSDACVPGHPQFILIAKLYNLLEELQDQLSCAHGKVVKQRISWDSNSSCWRDVMTGVRVELDE